MTAPPKDRRQKLLNKIAQAQAQLNDIEARERIKARKDDTRRKVIAGGLVLKHTEFDADFRASLFTLMNRYVDRPADRALFLELFPELPETSSRAQTEPPAVDQDQASPVRDAFKPAVGGG